MGGLEDTVAGHVVDVPPGCDADAAHLGGQGIGEIVAVEVGGGQDVELLGARQDLLEGDVGDAVLDQQLVAGPASAVVPADGDVGELLADQFVAPVAERPLGELLDVPLVDDVHAGPIVGQGVIDGRPDQPLRGELRDRLDADAGAFADLPSHLVAQERRELGRLGGVGLDLEAGVDVLGVLTEDDHVDLLGVEHRGGYAGEPPHRAEADVEVEDLAEGHVEGADAAADRRGQRALDADQVGAERLDGLVGQPTPGLVECFLAREHFLPRHRLTVLGGRGVEHQLRRRPDVHAGAIPFDEGDDGYVGYVEGAIGPRCDQFGHGQQPIGAPCHHPNRAGASPASGDECAGSAEARLRVWRGPGPSRSRGWHSTG